MPDEMIGFQPVLVAPNEASTTTGTIEMTKGHLLLCERWRHGWDGRTYLICKEGPGWR